MRVALQSASNVVRMLMMRGLLIYMSGRGIKLQWICIRGWGAFDLSHFLLFFFFSFSLLFIATANEKTVLADIYTTRYSVFRRVVNYYSDDPTGLSESGEDAFDMRKPCSRDKKLEHVRENGEDFPVGPEDVL